MSRVAIAAVLLSAAAAWPAAHAQARDSNAAALPAAHAGVHGALGEMCTQASVVLSTQRVTRAMSAVLPVAAPSPAAVPLPVDDEDGPWCVTQNDCRCAPVQHGSLPTRVDLQPKLSSVAALVIPWPRARELRATPFFEQPGQALAGERSRLERPPRTGR